MTEQTYFPGTEPPPEDPQRTAELDTMVNEIVDLEREAARLRITKNLKHSVFISLCIERGIDRYPFIDPATGKKRYKNVKREPKLTTTNAPKPRKPKKERKAKPFADDADKSPEEKNAARLEAKVEAEANRVEHRKVPRATVERDVDPFGAQRKELDELEKGNVH